MMGAAAVLMIVFLMVDPARGTADGSQLRPTTPVNDLKALSKNRSFVMSVVAFTCVTNSRFSTFNFLLQGPVGILESLSQLTKNGAS